MSHTYVAFKPCGCVRGVAVDEPDHAGDVAAAVGDWIRAGCTIERMETETVRTMPWRCEKDEQFHQLELIQIETANG